ncbi:helix-turn-helix domain-containing protein [Kordia jejudonensis]|uniref:helix-turn-helix domain-containing protein n=1 Tax=Kordia jejudonensis TaxID=1348245 RepID=UPI0006996F69|nr:helix-turn-helix transcriptional regulator [Kordia jejudonensis]
MKNTFIMEQPTLGKKIASLRKEKGLTQEELIEKCNVSIRTIQRIEAGEVTPRSYTVKAIFEALEYDFEADKAAEIAFEKSCEITPNWFQEPKVWLLVVAFILFFVCSLFFPYEDSNFTVMNGCYFVIMSAVQILLIGNYMAGQKKSRIPTKNGELQIAFNTAKVAGAIFLFIAFDVFIIYTIVHSVNFFNSDVTKYLMLASILLPIYFSIKLIYPYANKLLLKTANGFRITNEGIEDNSMLSLNTLIPWEEVERFDVVKSLYGFQWIVPILKNPEDVINLQTNHFAREITKSNYKQYGSPLRIYTNTLNINPSELYKILCIRLKKSKS